MKKFIPVYLYGLLIILEGIILLFSEYRTFNMINLALAITSIVGAFFAIIAAFSRERKQIQFAYHLIHALAMLVYGITVFVFCDTIEKLISITSFLFIFYSCSEIVFGCWLFNLGLKMVYKIIIVRFMLGLVIGIGTIAGMNFSESTLEIFGGLFILVGVNVVLYVPVIKGKESSEIQNVSIDS